MLTTAEINNLFSRWNSIASYSTINILLLLCYCYNFHSLIIIYLFIYKYKQWHLTCDVINKKKYSKKEIG